MAISRISAQDAQGTASAASVSATYASTPTAGNLLIAAVQENAGAGGAVITGWTLAKEQSSSASNDAYIFYKVSDGTESTTVTSTASGAGFMSIAVSEYQGFTTRPLLDKTAGGSSGAGGSSCPTGTTATTSGADELLVGIGAIAGVLATSPSWSNTFTTLATVTNTPATKVLFTAERIVSATGAYTSTVSYTGVSTSAAGIIATFKNTALSGFFALVR